VVEKDTSKQKLSYSDNFILAFGLVVGYFCGLMNAEELKAKRKLLDLSQEAMAEKLNGTPVSTYRKWEQGVRKVPKLVEDILTPKENFVPGLSLKEIYALDRLARSQDMTIEQLAGKALSDLAKTALAIALFLVVGYQVSHPSENVARRFSRRRPEAICLSDCEEA